MRLEDALWLLHGVRFLIISVLMRREAYLSELESELGISRKILEYHLRMMEGRGFVSSRPGEREGRPVRLYRATDLAKEALELIKGELDRILEGDGPAD